MKPAMRGRVAPASHQNFAQEREKTRQNESAGFCFSTSASVPAQARPPWWLACWRILSGQCFQGSCQTALMASCLVFVDDLLVSDTVDGRHGCLEDCSSSCLVTALDRFASSFDSRAQGRTLGRIVCVLLNCLTSAFARLCGICHGIS